MFTPRKVLKAGPRTSMTKARLFYIFEEVLVRVRQAQAGLITDLLLDHITDQYIKKMNNSDPDDLDGYYRDDDVETMDNYYRNRDK